MNEQSSFYAIIVVPVGIVIAGLVIEYWIIQPLKQRVKNSNPEIEGIREAKKFGLSSYIGQILVSTKTVNLNKLGVRTIEKVGMSIVNLPILLTKAISSFVIVFIAIPIFVFLYYTEKNSVCRFNPSCKVYLIDALENHGLVKGFFLALRRVLRCNPLYEGGDDPVPVIKSER